MIKELSALHLNSLVKDFQVLVNGKVDQIYQHDEKDISIQFYLSGKGKMILRILPKFVFLSSKKPESKDFGFCKYLRKQLNNSVLREISQIDFERILKLSFETKTDKFDLFVELFDAGNVILTKNNTILSALELKKWADREILPKKEYVYPKRKFNFLKINEKELKELLNESKQESLVKALAVDLGLGGQFAEKLCESSNNNKDIPPDKAKSNTLFSEIKELREIKLENLNSELDEQLSKAAVEKQAVEKTKAKNEKLEKIQKIISMQQKNLDKFEKQAVENQRKGELIYENYKLVEEILAEIKKARAKFSWKEIKEKLKGHKTVKDINEAEGLVEIEI